MSPVSTRNARLATSASRSTRETYSEPGTYTVTLTVGDDDGGATTDTWMVTVLSPEEAKHDISDYIQGLPDEAFEKNPTQRKKALENMFSAIDRMLDNGAYRGAIEDLRHNIREKADGRIDGEANNDWIVDEDAQYHICMKIDDLIAYLESLL
jgi:PKD repeat protein